MKRRRLREEEKVTEHIVVTQEVFRLLWKLRVSMRERRLSDVILKLIRGEIKQ